MCAKGFTEVESSCVCIIPKIVKDNMCLTSDELNQSGCIENKCFEVIKFNLNLFFSKLLIKQGFIKNDQSCDCDYSADRQYVKNICCHKQEVNSFGYCDDHCPFNFTKNTDSLCECLSPNQIVDTVCLTPGNVVQSGCDGNKCLEGFTNNSSICECTGGRFIRGDICCLGREVNSLGYCDEICPKNYISDDDSKCICSTTTTEKHNVCLIDSNNIVENGCEVNVCEEGYYMKSASLCECRIDENRKMIKKICCTNDEFNSQGICDTACPSAFIANDDGLCECLAPNVISYGVCYNSSKVAQNIKGWKPDLGHGYTVHNHMPPISPSHYNFNLLYSPRGTV